MSTLYYIMGLRAGISVKYLKWPSVILEENTERKVRAVKYEGKLYNDGF